MVEHTTHHLLASQGPPAGAISRGKGQTGRSTRPPPLSPLHRPQAHSRQPCKDPSMVSARWTTQHCHSRNGSPVTHANQETPRHPFEQSAKAQAWQHQYLEVLWGSARGVQGLCTATRCPELVLVPQALRLQDVLLCVQGQWAGVSPSPGSSWLGIQFSTERFYLVPLGPWPQALCWDTALQCSALCPSWSLRR